MDTTGTTADGPEVLAAGAVLWRPATDGGAPEVALVHRPRYDDWSFPKGKLEAGESMPGAAVREVAEETGYAAWLGPLLADVRYTVPEGPKLVRYWAAQARSGAFAANEETDELRWVDAVRAGEMLSYRHDLDVLSRFTAVGVPESTVVLVRHAKAGSRAKWDGEDDLRPLSAPGRDQVRRLTGLLALFGADRVVSAPPLRCRATVAPLADALGLPVVEEPRLGEEGYWMRPGAARARFRELAAAPGVTVVCSQGGVIPDLIGDLADRTRLSGVKADDVPSRKASVWVLTWAAGAPRTADHYPPPA